MFQKVLGTPGINPIRTKTNHIIEMHEVLGIEAARNQIVVEIEKIYTGYGLTVDERHLMLLADLMTFKGQVRAHIRAHFDARTRAHARWHARAHSHSHSTHSHTRAHAQMHAHTHAHTPLATCRCAA